MAGPFASLQQLVQNFESGGNYSAVNPNPAPGSSAASGAYQFVDSTWQRYANQIGVDTSAYPTAASAPANVQDQVFNQAVSQNGLGDWTCTGCNAPLSNYLASNPDQASLPVFAGGSGGGGTTTDNGGGTPGYGQQILNGLNTLGNTNPFNMITNPVGSVGGAVMSTPAGASAVNGAVQTGVSSVFAWLLSSRVALAVLAVIFIGGAILLFAIRSGIDINLPTPAAA